MISSKRIFGLAVMFSIICCLLAGRLVYLHLVAGPRLAIQSLGSRIQEVPVDVDRGEILDRNGVPLTNTAQHFSLAVFPTHIADVRRATAELAELTGFDAAKIAARIDRDGRPFKLKTDMDAMSARKVNARHIPGVMAVAEKVRYGYSSLAAHVVGYINAADNRGVSGIEGMYDDILRGGQPTYLVAVVDAGQQLIPGLGYKRLRLADGGGPSHVVLTIDSRTQKIVEKVMDENIVKGAVVVMRPGTGELLAMASRPGFDANNLGEYLGRGTAPLLNRAVAAYQPGSVFKLVVASAALEEGVVSPNDQFYDPGYIDINGLRFKGWDFEQGGRGKLSFAEAMAYSSNPVLIQVGTKLGAAKLIDYADRLGFGHKTKLEFDGEADGNLPTPDSVYPGDLANLAIGQGTLEATPLQIACMVATIVNDGVAVDPYIVSRLTAADGTIVKSFPASRGHRVLSRRTAGQLRTMMQAVTRVGTGQEAYVEGFGSAGKTGTAETGRSGPAGRSVNHAWFAGYAPLDNPRYVVVVFVEDGMSGGDVAAPIFREITARILAGG
ncbi:peptidoglycan D,D-transpeptidase FtsI family protein [Anaeroselena agilis]|uniref:Penicillin-binding transpeptidase domain-containing protein n=1 Tax=Anaeroselena agilis TaxID=3063788 RepID=A0ABU3NXT7_9FIRM|nr:penicillin-binding transpeptidase domain-containing protein [Selenomonadales bacterium 4137-cl]